MDYSEKRDFQRMVMNCSMEYQLDGEKDICQGSIINLSAKGMLFLASDAIQTGTSIKMKLTPAKSITSPMSADILVSRCDKLSENEYQIAAEIVQIQ